GQVPRGVGEVTQLEPLERPAVGATGALEIAPRFGERDVEAAFASLQPALYELQGKRRFTRPGIALNQIEGVGEKASKQHVVETRNVRRNHGGGLGGAASQFRDGRPPHSFHSFAGPGAHPTNFRRSWGN